MIGMSIYQARHSKYPWLDGLGKPQSMEKIGKGMENYTWFTT